MKNLQTIKIFDYTLKNGVVQSRIILSYEFFGLPLEKAPIVLVNHALTGNSTVTGDGGWWSSLIGYNKTIDLNHYTVIAFNIPGNGYLDKENLIGNYQDFTTYDIADIFWKGLDILGVSRLFAVIGGSLGGAIGWEMATQRPASIKNLIPVAAHWQSSDWLISNVLVQDLILNNSKNPIHDARIHAMLLYRTPGSLQYKFIRKYQDDSPSQFQVESWLIHHGKKLENRFDLLAYMLMNHLLKTIDISQNNIKNPVEEITKIKSDIHLISIDSDMFFLADENKKTYKKLKDKKENIFYHEITSIHGHDAFLIEYDQLNKIVKPIFNSPQTFKEEIV